MLNIHREIEFSSEDVIDNLAQQSWQFLFQMFCSGKPSKLWKKISCSGDSQSRQTRWQPEKLSTYKYIFTKRNVKTNGFILKQISLNIEKTIPSYQVGFKRSRYCCEQVTALTSHIEKCFNDRQKAGATFIDLSTTCDTVWKHGLLNKLTKIIPCKWTIKYIDDVKL